MKRLSFSFARYVQKNAFLMLLLWAALLRSEERSTQYYEILLTNNTTESVKVTIEPVGFIFNDLFEYSLRSSIEKEQAPNQLITGDTVYIPAGRELGGVVDHIATRPQSGVYRHIGYGKYKMTVERWGYIYIDYTDSDYPEWYANNFWPRDLFFVLKASGDLYWKDENSPNEVKLQPGETIQIWDQTSIDSELVKSQNKSGFKIPASVTTLPLDGTDNVVTHFTPGKLCVPVTIQANTSIAQGKAFEPQAGIELSFLSGKTLFVGGTLNALGSSSSPIIFTHNGSGTWDGIQFNSGSSGTLEYATIRHASKGIYIDHTNAVTVNHCTIENFTEQGIYAYATSGSIENSTLQNPSAASHGIYVKSKPAGSGIMHILNNTIRDVTTGIEVFNNENNDDIEIHGNSIEGCDTGIKILMANAEIDNNTIDGDDDYNSYGIRIQFEGIPNIHDNDIFANGVGVALEQSQPSSIKWNNFGYSGGQMQANHDFGILVNTLSSGNSFLNNLRVAHPGNGFCRQDEHCGCTI